MAFVKKTWLARLGQGLNKFIFNGGSKVTLESSPDTVTQQGTPLSAENMNDLEQRIADEFSNQNDAINAIIKIEEVNTNVDLSPNREIIDTIEYDISQYTGYTLVSVSPVYVNGDVTIQVLSMSSSEIYYYLKNRSSTAYGVKSVRMRLLLVKDT